MRAAGLSGSASVAVAPGGRPARILAAPASQPGAPTASGNSRESGARTGGFGGRGRQSLLGGPGALLSVASLAPPAARARQVCTCGGSADLPAYLAVGSEEACPCCVYRSTHVYLQRQIRVYLFVHTYILTYKYIDMSMYICICIYVYIYVQIHAHVHGAHAHVHLRRMNCKLFCCSRVLHPSE